MVSIDVDYAHPGVTLDHAISTDAAKYGVTVKPTGEVYNGIPVVTISGDHDAVQNFLTAEGYDDPDLYTLPDVGEEQQTAEIDALTTWLRSLSTKEYRTRVLTLAGWLDVLDLEAATDDLKGYVEVLSRPDSTEE